MKTAILMVILCSCLSSCAMSVNHDKLIEGVSRLSPIEEVEIIVTISPWETEYYCHKHSIGLVWGVINCAINACFVPACAVPLVDKEGVIRASRFQGAAVVIPASRWRAARAAGASFRTLRS